MIRKIFLVLLVVGMCAGFVVVGKGYKMYKDALAQTSLTEMVEEVRSKEDYTPYGELPETYIDAVISVEDHRFYEHAGMDFIATGRAILNDIKAMSLVEGGSTITQQLAKNLYFTQEKKFTRKIAEVFMAFEIERNYSKQEIMELYLNSIYFGDGYYCVKDASMGYFGVEPKDMSEDQCTMLAGIPNAPSVYSPTKNPELAKQRQDQVIKKMIKYNYLTSEEALLIY